MKKLKLFLMLFIAAVSVCNFVSCDKDDDKGGASSIVGTWVLQEDGDFESYTFTSGGTYTNSWQESDGKYGAFYGVYTYEGKTLTLKDSEHGWVDTYQATISGNKLTLIDEDGYKEVYTRK